MTGGSLADHLAILVTRLKFNGVNGYYTGCLPPPRNCFLFTATVIARFCPLIAEKYDFAFGNSVEFHSTFLRIGIYGSL